jgi:F-type H+-transporting ATPase subunit b
MELSGSTFLLEMINFLVLIWLLQRFFYKPLQAVIARRRAGFEQQLADAKTMNQQAQQLQTQYENRLSHGEQERQQARETLQQELNRERARQEAVLQESLDQARERAQVSLQRREQALLLQLEQQALRQASRFAARILEHSAGPELESRLLALLLESLPQLPAEQRQALREQEAEHLEPIEIRSAFALDSGAREQLQQGLQQLLDRSIECHFVEDRALLAGLRISIGPWLLRASLQDELQSFADAALTTNNAVGPCHATEPKTQAPADE